MTLKQVDTNRQVVSGRGHEDLTHSPSYANDASSDSMLTSH